MRKFPGLLAYTHVSGIPRSSVDFGFNQVFVGKYLIEGFIQTPDGDDGNLEEHIYGHCLEVHYRLMGGVSLLGVWSTFDEDSVSIKVFKRLRKAEIITTDFVSILFYDDKTSKAKRIRESGDVQKVDVKTTSHLKWPTCVASANFSIISQIATGENS